MMNQIEEIEIIKNMVKRFYDKGENKSDRHDAEDEIKHFLDNHPEVSSKKIADDIWERCHYIMKHGDYHFEESWGMIETLLTDIADGLYDQLKESVLIFSKTGRRSDLDEIKERFHDYLKHVVELDKKVGKESIRHKLEEDICKNLENKKYNNDNFEQMWSIVQDKIDFAWSLTGDDIGNPKKMSDEELRRTFVPDVYQKDIYLIDYSKLKAAGVKLITFDIDATLGLPGMFKASSEAKNLFAKLLEMGFQVGIFSNAPKARVCEVQKELGAFAYLGHGGKPHTFGFDFFIEEYVSRNFGPELTHKQIAHVGNDITKDVQAGNKAGVITCLVRNFGGSFGLTRILYPEAHYVTEMLKKKNIWRKHHEKMLNDQYYQLGEKQK